MRITNLSKKSIMCKVDNKCIFLGSCQSFECVGDFDVVSFTPSDRSYSVLESEKSRILKLLSIFDDPFKLIKEYHLVINSSFIKDCICNFRQLNLTVETYYVDTSTRTYYDFIKVEAEGMRVKPNKVNVLSQTEIFADFLLNNKKLAKWQCMWDIVIEPIFLEVIGYYAVYQLFSIWLDEKAWNVVLLLLVPNVLIEVLMLFLKRKKFLKRVQVFQSYFDELIIHQNTMGR